MNDTASTQTAFKPIEQGNPADDGRAFRRCLGQYATGVAVITVKHGDPFTQAVVKDHLGRTIEVRFGDLLPWPDVVMMEKDFGTLYVGETVDILDPSTSDGDTIVVSIHGKEMRVPVALLTPVKQHAWKAANAV